MTTVPDSFPPPALISREMADDQLISIGDNARVRLDAPGLLAHLMTPVGAPAVPPGRGLHPMTGVPMGLAIEAAIQAVDGKRRGVDVLRACNASFLSPADWLVPMEASAQVHAVTPRSVEIDAEVRNEATGAIVLRARIVLVRVVGGRAMELQRVVK